jgi:hypothetical protein
MRRAILIGAVALYAGAAWAQSFQNVTDVSGTANAGLFGTNLAWGDYDSDGNLDLYATNWGTAVSNPVNALFHNEGDGTFTDQAAQAGVDINKNSTAAAFADYDNDGDLDLYIADFFDQDFLYQNQGDGTFVEVGRSRGLIDLTRQGSGTAIAWGDYNGDGHLDLYLGKYYFTNDLYENRGDGTFLQVKGDKLGLGDKRDTDDVYWADYDNDGDLDLYTVNREQENGLYRNDLNETDTFPAIACALSVANGEIGQGGAFADYDNDGDLDLYLANVGANALYRNDGAESFQDVAQEAGIRIDSGGWITAMATWADYDGDGWLDLYLANGADRQQQRDILYASNGDLTFRNATAEANLSTSASAHLSAGFADYDGNGSPDLYTTSGFGEGGQLFQNGTPGSRFVKVFARGKGGQQGGANLDGIGARISLLDNADTIVAFRQTNDPNGVIFGVEEGQTYSVQIRFPGSAAAVTASDVQGGDHITVVEP